MHIVVIVLLCQRERESDRESGNRNDSPTSVVAAASEAVNGNGKLAWSRLKWFLVVMPVTHISSTFCMCVCWLVMHAYTLRVVCDAANWVTHVWCVMSYVFSVFSRFYGDFAHRVHWRNFAAAKNQ